MPNDEKQKKQKDPSRKARGIQGKATHRSEGHSDLVIEQFMKGKKADLFIAKVTKVHGGAARFDLEDDASGIYESVGIKGNLRLSRKASRNPAVKTAIDLHDDVLTDGGQIYAVLQPHEASHIRQKKLGAITKAGNSPLSGNSLFNREEVRNRGLSEAMATRKAAHKKTTRSGSGSKGSAAGSMGSGVGHVSRSASPNENTESGERMGKYTFKGKKVFSASGREVVGEEKRQAKRALEAKKTRKAGATGGR